MFIIIKIEILFQNNRYLHMKIEFRHSHASILDNFKIKFSY